MLIGYARMPTYDQDLPLGVEHSRELKAQMRAAGLSV